MELYGLSKKYILDHHPLNTYIDTRPAILRYYSFHVLMLGHHVIVAVSVDNPYSSDSIVKRVA